MTRWQRFIIQAIVMVGTIAIIVMVGSSGIRGMPLVLIATVLTTISYTIIDALQNDGRPGDPTWVRRKITSNLIYTVIVVGVYLMLAGVPGPSEPAKSARSAGDAATKADRGEN